MAKCDKPKEVCLIFDGVGEFLVERCFARRISKEEGLNGLDQAEAGGWSIRATTAQTKPT